MEKKIQILSTYPLSDELIENAQLNHPAHLDESYAERHNLSIQWTSIPFIQTLLHLEKETANRINELSSQSITAIFTSAHAVEAVFSILDSGFKPDWTVYCLAGKTRDAVLQHLPNSAIVATADYGKALGEKIQQLHKGNSTYYFFCGNIRMPTLPELLSTYHIPLEEIKVYKTVLTPQKVSADVDGILFFSPSAVRSFFELNKPDSKTILFSVGNTTSQAIQQYTANQVITSPAPRAALVVKAVLEYFEQNPPGQLKNIK